MAKDTLIDKHVSTKLCEKAIEALLKYTQKRRAEEDESTLFRDEEQTIWLVIALKQMHPNAYKLKPHRIPLVHSIVDPRTTPICLITRDPQRKYKDLLQEKNIKFVSRVVGITKLKGKFKPFEPRRQLMSEHGLFFADNSVIPLLPGLLGKIFFKAKKQPIPVNLQHTNLKAHLESAVSSTYLHLNAGTCTSVKIGMTGMAAVKLLENLQIALPEIIKCLAPTKRRRTEEDSGEEGDSWGNIQSLMIKTSESVSLPIWSCQLGSGEGGRWDGLLAEQLEMEAEEEEHDGPSIISAKQKSMKLSLAEAPDTSKRNRKKRAAEESKEEPKRKRKRIPVGTDEVISEMKGLAIEKATPAKTKNAKTEGKTAETDGPAPVMIKIKAPSSTSAPPKPAPLTPTPGPARRPKKKTGEEKVSGKAEVGLPSANTTKPPAEIKPDHNKAGKGNKAKFKTAPIEAQPKPAKDEKAKAEKKKDATGDKEPKLMSISTPKPAILPRQAGETVKPLKSAIKSSSPRDGVKVKKKISFDLRSGKEAKGKKIGGKLSSKERLVGRGPRNA